MEKGFSLADIMGKENIGVLYDTMSKWRTQRKQAERRNATNSAVNVQKQKDDNKKNG